jgi:ketosteroid isomerase-like protein
MWKHLSVGIALILAAHVCTAQSDEEQAIHRVEDQIAAATGNNDADALGKLRASDYVFVNPAGQRITRAERLQTKEESYTRDEESIRVYGDTAIVFYRATAAASQYRVTSVLVNQGGQWREVSRQSSLIRGSANSAAISSLHQELKPADHREQDVRAAEQQIAEATDKDDADKLESLWAPEFVWVGPVGNVLTRAQRLAQIRSGREKSAGYSIDQEDVRIYGPTAVVTFRSTVAGVIDGKDISGRRRVTNVLVHRDGHWQAVSQHSTLIVQP